MLKPPGADGNIWSAKQLVSRDSFMWSKRKLQLSSEPYFQVSVSANA